jgi:hypothetical protein
MNVPFGSVANTVLDDLGLGNGSRLLEELLQLARAETSRQLLDKHGAAVALVAGGRGVARGAVAPASAVLIAAAITAVVAALISRRAVVAGRRAGARAATATTAAVAAAAVVVSVSVMTT